MTKETGIIMSGSHPVDILEGRKTQTRRVFKIQPFNQMLIPLLVTSDTWGWFKNSRKDLPEGLLFKCPYGQVGDMLWVRGTWAVDKLWDDKKPSEINSSVSVWYKTEYRGAWVGKTRSPRFMPRWASRITLEIIELGAEHLRVITSADALAEGGYTVEEYISLFLKLNKLPEDADPWNWVISFKKVSGG